jgi:hypothetical protein
MKNKIIKFVLLNTIDFKTLSNSFSLVSNISSFLLTILFSTSFIFPLSVSADVLSILEKEALYYLITM